VSRSSARGLAGIAGSLLIHGVLALIVVAYGKRVAAEHHVVAKPKDVWAGETVEISDLLGAPGEPAPRLEEPEPNLQKPAPRLEKPEPHRETRRLETREPTPPKPADPHDDLVRRILEYKPKPRAPRPSEADGDALAGEATSARSFGAEGASSEPRDFARAFTRAIPAATTGEPAWTRMPAGPAGKLRVKFEIDEEGHISDHDVGKDPPPDLERLVESTLLALSGGRFALTTATKGEQRLQISVELSDHPLAEGPLELGFRTPRPGAPGVAYFQLASGRRVDVAVELLP
jgi:hypothetical protein